MPRKRKAVAIDDAPVEYTPQTGPMRQFGPLAILMWRFTIEKTWGYKRRDAELAMDCPVFLEMLRQFHLAGDDADHVPLAPIWQAAGEPEGKSPADYRAQQERDAAARPADPHDGIALVDGPEGAILGTHEAAAWYASWLDEQVFGPAEVCEMFY